MNINYDIYDSQNPNHLALARLIVNKQIFATGNEYAAACRFCAVQLEVTQKGVEVQFPPVALDEDIEIWVSELKEHGLPIIITKEKLFLVEIPACLSYLDAAEQMAYRLEIEYQMTAVVKGDTLNLDVYQNGSYVGSRKHNQSVKRYEDKP